MGLVITLLSALLSVEGHASTYSFSLLGPDTPPEGPTSAFLETLEGGPDPSFCSEWNPEFSYRGCRCCPKKPVRRKGGAPSRCAPHRRKGSYCDEMTQTQKNYAEATAKGRLGDLLSLIRSEMGLRGEQAYCGVSDGFLAWGRPLVATSQNRIRLRSPHRCAYFGTDAMIGMLEWLGREVSTKYADPAFAATHLLVGDISAPKGGCLSGRGGRRGHRSHTSGVDADIGFLWAKEGKSSPEHFHRQFDAKTNWWLLKKIFQNPFACIQVIFLDSRLIRQLAKVAASDPEWALYRPYLKHVRGHRNHYHIRIGGRAGPPGCSMMMEPEPEEEEESESLFDFGASGAAQS